MVEFLSDLSYGLRMLRKTPGATAIAIVALTLGIGANSAIFSVVSSILIRPLPYSDPDQIVAVFENKLDKGMHRQLISPLDYKSYAELSQSFDGVGAIRNLPLVLSGRDIPERIDGAAVTPSIFEILAMKPAIGRTFDETEAQPQNNDRVIISDGLWRRRFAGETRVLGSTLTLDGRAYTLVGIAPAGFSLVDSPSELWIPYTPDPGEMIPSKQGLHALRVLARLKPEVSRRQAEQEMQAIARRLAESNPNTNAGYSAEVIPLREVVVGNIGATLWTLTMAVVVVLLIACANVANLLLARLGSREKEIAVRSSLGASSGRIIRQMLAESVLLALIAGILGLALAFWGTAIIVKFAPQNIPRLHEISVDWRVLLFTLLISLATGVLFGLAPALASIKSDLNAVLRASGRSNASTVAKSRMRDIFVVSEIACCLVLLTSAGLLMRSFARLASVDPGFRHDHVLTMQLALPPTRYSGVKIPLFYKDLLSRVQALPGVQAAGISRFLPLSGPDVSMNFQIEGQPLLSVADQPRAKFRATSSGYFAALGIPLVSGRLIDATDGEQTPKVVVINEAAARQYWPHENPVGKRILSGADKNVWSTVIGVVRDVKHASLDADTSPETYFQYQQIPAGALNLTEGTMFLAIRTSADPTSLASAVRRELRVLDPDQPVFNVRTMDTVLEASVAQPRFRMLLLAILAGLALVLASIGLYGIMSYTVSQRISELGVRMALGAAPGDIGRLVVGHALKITLLGTGIGLLLAAASSAAISSFLFGVHAIDGLTFASACLLTIVVSLIASAVPALRATRVAPAEALRTE